MSKRFIVIFALAFCFLTFSEVKAQSLLKTNKIPEDLVIKYWRGNAIGWSEYTIKSNGTISYNYYSNIPSNPDHSASLFELLGKNKKARKPKLKDNLSKEQLKNLISEFEKAKFFNFTNNMLNNQDGCTNENVSSDPQTMSISIQINGKNKQVFSYAECNGSATSNAAKFIILGKKISEALKNVKATMAK